MELKNKVKSKPNEQHFLKMLLAVDKMIILNLSMSRADTRHVLFLQKKFKDAR